MIEHIVIKPNPTLIIGDSFSVGDTDVFHMKGSGFYIELTDDNVFSVDCSKDDLESTIFFLWVNIGSLILLDRLGLRSIKVTDDHFVANVDFDIQIRLADLKYRATFSESRFEDGKDYSTVVFTHDTHAFKPEFVCVDQLGVDVDFELRLRIKDK